MKAFVINLDRALERWGHMRDVFRGMPLELVRVSAVEGGALRLPIPEFDELQFRRFHGRGTNIFEVACYLSHLKAMRAFLETDESHALICEDDLHSKPELPGVIAALMTTARSWNIARLAGLKLGRPSKICALGEGYFLSVPRHRFKGTGAYIVDRKAAERLSSGLLPMWLPYDHALDREWVYGLKVVSVAPFPISQTAEIFSSGIQGHAQKRLSARQRWMTTYPYQIRNEVLRFCMRLLQVRRLKRQLPRVGEPC